MESRAIKQNYKFKNNNSFIYISNTPKVLRFSKTPQNIDKKNIIQNQNKLNNNKMLLKKNPYINFNFNLIQNKNMNQNKIRTITPNLKLREIVNKKFRENNNYDIGNIFKMRTELPDITRNNHNYFHIRSYMNTEYSKKKESNEKIDRQLKLIFVMKNKINELNKVIKDKNKEILILKNYAHLNNNNYNNTINKIKAEKEKNINEEKNINNIYNINNETKEKKNCFKDKENNLKKRNFQKESLNKNKLTRKLTPIMGSKKNEEVDKLNKEIKNLNKIINDLDEKYQNEIKKNVEFNQKFTFMKNCTFGLNAPKVQIEERIKNYENKIIDLEEQLYQYKQRETKEKIILSNEEYSNIKICLNALLLLNKINDKNILTSNEQITFENIEKISNDICDLLKISNNNTINNFINDYIIKNTQNVLTALTFEELFLYNPPKDNYFNYNLFSFIKERCIVYDYRKEGKVPIIYLRHLYNEFCYKNKKEKNEKEFFDIVYLCKKNIKKSFHNNVQDIYYDNLINNVSDSFIVKNFIDSIMNEEIEKVREREKYNNLLKNKNINGNENNKSYNSNVNDNFNDDFII